MDYVDLGTSGINVSPIALGCWAFGGDRFWGPQEDRDSEETVSAALDSGINFFDNARVYGDDGRAERVLGNALTGRRSQAVIATKAAGGDLAEDALEDACNLSLQRLGTDYIDLYYIHWPNPTVPIEQTVRGMERLLTSGKVRCLGISNFGPVNLAGLEKTGKSHLFAVHQLPYNLLWRAIEHEVLPETVKHGMGIVAYSTIAQGLLTGSYSAVEEVPDYMKITRFYNASHVDADHGEEGCEAEVFEAVAALKEIAADEGISLPELSLAWLLEQEAVTVLLSGARTPDEIRQNVKALDVTVSPGAVEAARSATELVKTKIGKNPDMWMGGAQSRYV